MSTTKTTPRFIKLTDTVAVSREFLSKIEYFLVDGFSINFFSEKSLEDDHPILCIDIKDSCDVGSDTDDIEAKTKELYNSILAKLENLDFPVDNVQDGLQKAKSVAVEKIQNVVGSIFE